MNIIYRSQAKQEDCLVVPPEAVRGLTYTGGQWCVHVSDPEAMSVSKFLLSKDTVKEATQDLHLHEDQSQPLTPQEGKQLLEWLLAQPFVQAERVGDSGLPSMFPGFPANGPRPTLGMKTPAMAR